MRLESEMGMRLESQLGMRLEYGRGWGWSRE
jgi:hypothetical protein